MSTDTKIDPRLLRIPTVKRKPKAKSLPRFVPVIFANGQDDDAPGLQAAIDDEPVQLDERVYEPGENIWIDRRMLVLSRPLRGGSVSGRWIHISNSVLQGPW